MKLNMIIKGRCCHQCAPTCLHFQEGHEYPTEKYNYIINNKYLMCKEKNPLIFKSNLNKLDLTYPNFPIFQTSASRAFNFLKLIFTYSVHCKIFNPWSNIAK